MPVTPVAINEQNPFLTQTEIDRVAQHSKQANSLYQALIAYNQQRLHGDDIGSKLSQLVVALRQGGRNGNGQEKNAGYQANLGIVDFYNYWDSLSKPQQAAIFKATPDLQKIIGRLFRPQEAQYLQVIYCVELMAIDLDLIITEYKLKPHLQEFKRDFLTQKDKFSKASETSHDLAFIPKDIHPKHQWHYLKTQ